jgi:hypothetical protein
VGLLVGLVTAVVSRDCPDPLGRDGSDSDAEAEGIPRDRDTATPKES